MLRPACVSTPIVAPELTSSSCSTFLYYLCTESKLAPLSPIPPKYEVPNSVFRKIGISVCSTSASGGYMRSASPSCTTRQSLTLLGHIFGYSQIRRHYHLSFYIYWQATRTFCVAWNAQNWPMRESAPIVIPAILAPLLPRVY